MREEPKVDPKTHTPISRSKIRAISRRLRRWMIWQMDYLASMEARTAHQIEELQILEQRLLQPIDESNPDKFEVK